MNLVYYLSDVLLCCLPCTDGTATTETILKFTTWHVLAVQYTVRYMWLMWPQPKLLWQLQNAETVSTAWKTDGLLV